jgi:hypothetical protein
LCPVGYPGRPVQFLLNTFSVMWLPGLRSVVGHA